MKDYLVHFDWFQIVTVKAKDEDDARQKAKKKIPAALRNKVHGSVKLMFPRCAGTWRKGCTGTATSIDGECNKCSYERRQDYYNSPG